MSPFTYLVVINVVLFSLAVSGFWSISVPLPDSMANQTCCKECNFSNISVDVRDDEQMSNPHHLLKIYLWVTSFSYLAISVVPWSRLDKFSKMNKQDQGSILCVGIFLTIVGYVGLLSSAASFLTEYTGYSQCFYPSTSPLKLIIRERPYDFFLLILPFIITGVFLSFMVLFILVCFSILLIQFWCCSGNLEPTDIPNDEIPPRYSEKDKVTEV